MIDFPSNPTDGQLFTSGNSSWVWNAAASQWRTALIPNVVLDNTITAAKLTSTAVTDKLGYTPVNKAGDTMTGGLIMGGNSRINALNDALALRKSSAVTGQLYLDYQNTAGAEIAYIGYGSAGDDKFTVANTLSDIQLMAGSIVGLAVDTTGRVKMPYQPAFFAYGLPANLYANYGGGAITFATTPLNQGSSWNGSRFTAPIAGTYLMYFDAMYTHRGGDFALMVWKNGAAVAYNNAYGRDNVGNYEQWTSSTVSWIGTLAANDYVDFRYGSSSDTSTYLYASGLYTRCYGYMIG